MNIAVVMMGLGIFMLGLAMFITGVRRMREASKRENAQREAPE